MFYFKRAMKNKFTNKIISAILIFTIAAPFWFFYSILHIEKYSVKKEIKKMVVAGIDRDDLVLIKVSGDEAKTKLTWEHSKEFEYLGTMYDVVETEQRGDSTYYWCWEDSKETQLNKQLQNLVDNALSTNKNVNDNLKRLSNFFTSLYYSKISTFDKDFNKSTPLVFDFTADCSMLPNDPLLPPPKPRFS